MSSNLLTDQSFVVLDKSLGSPRASRVPHWKRVLSHLLLTWKEWDSESLKAAYVHWDQKWLPSKVPVIKRIYYKRYLPSKEHASEEPAIRCTCMKRRPFGSMASPSVCEVLFPTCKEGLLLWDWQNIVDQGAFRFPFRYCFRCNCTSWNLPEGLNEWKIWFQIFWLCLKWVFQNKYQGGENVNLNSNANI